LGLPAGQGVGTALLFSAAVKINAIIVYLYRREVDRKALSYMLAGGIPGAVAGFLGMESLHGARGNGLILLLVGATVAAAAGFSLLRSYLGAGLHRERLGLLPVMSFPIGMSVGFSSAGAGVLGTVLLFSTTKLAPVSVVGTDLVFGMAVSAVGGALHVAVGTWSGAALLKLLAGGLVGATAGSQLAGILPARILRITVLLCALLMGTLLLHRGVRAMF
jgi:uncharacterized membrane protein YfcA